MVSLATRSRRVLKCPYCRDRFATERFVSKCSKCRTLHHVTCWADYKKCSVYGCAGNEIVAVSEDETIRVFQERRRRLFLAIPFLVMLGFVAVLSLTTIFPIIYQRLIVSAIMSAPAFLIYLALFDIYYRCPACGHTPRHLPTDKGWKTTYWYSAWEKKSYRVQLPNNPFKLLPLFNPNECPTCKARLQYS